MRQVDIDELTYEMFSGLRRWTLTTRRRVFAPLAKRDDTHRIVPCKLLAERLMWVIIDPTDGSSVPSERVAAIFYSAIDKFPGSIGALWLSGIHDREVEARSAAAVLLAAALDPYEILSSTSLGQSGEVLVRFPQIIAAPHALRATWP